MPRKPNPASSHIQIRVTPSMLEAVKTRAEVDGFTMSEWIKRLIEKELAALYRCERVEDGKTVETRFIPKSGKNAHQLYNELHAEDGGDWEIWPASEAREEMEAYTFKLTGKKLR